MAKRKVKRSAKRVRTSKRAKLAQPRKATVAELLDNLKADLNAMRVRHAAGSKSDIDKMGDELGVLALDVQAIINRV